KIAKSPTRYQFFRARPVLRSINIYGAIGAYLITQQPRAVKTVPLHQRFPARHVDRAFAMEGRRQFLSSRNRRIETSAQTKPTLTVLEIDPVRVVFGRDWKRRDNRVRAAALQQLDTGVNVASAAQRVGRLEQTEGVETVAVLFEEPDGVLGHGQHRSFVARQF